MVVVPPRCRATPNGPLAIHLLNRRYDQEKDAMVPLAEFTLRLRRDLWASGGLPMHSCTLRGRSLCVWMSSPTANIRSSRSLAWTFGLWWNFRTRPQQFGENVLRGLGADGKARIGCVCRTSRMKQIPETSRLILREMSLADLDFVAAMLADPEVMRDYPKCYSREEAETWVQRQMNRYARHGHGLWLVLEKSSGQPVGQVGLLIQQFHGVDEKEIAYLIHRPFWRRGRDGGGPRLP